MSDRDRRLLEHIAAELEPKAAEEALIEVVNRTPTEVPS